MAGLHVHHTDLSEMNLMQVRHSRFRCSWFPTLSLFVVIAASVFVGCGGGGAKGPAMHSVAGTVTLDGQPLSQGSIVFDPADGKGTATSCGIKDGAFKGTCPVGAKIVRISASKESSEKDEYGSVVSVSLIPDAYNSSSTLKADIAAKDNTGLKFELLSKPNP